MSSWTTAVVHYSGNLLKSSVLLLQGLKEKHIIGASQTFWMLFLCFWSIGASQTFWMFFLCFWSIFRHIFVVSSSCKFLSLFWNSEDRASWYILIIKTNEMHYFSNLFWCRTLHISDRSTVHHQESSTVYTAIGICSIVYADCLLAMSWPR